MSAMFRSLRNRNYRVWAAGALISNIGTWMQATAQSWVVLTELTRTDAFAVGITMALQFAPQILLVPVSGTIADRFNRRTVLFITQSTLGVLALGQGLLLLGGNAQLWQLYTFAALFGTVNSIDIPVRQSFISNLVSAHDMPNAIGLNSASFNLARMIGPAIAGTLVAVLNSGTVFLVNAGSFLAVVLALCALPGSRPATDNTIRGTRSLLEGFRYVRKRPDILLIFVIMFLIGTFGMNFPIICSTMSVMFGQGPSAYGLLSSIIAVGSFGGALLVARSRRSHLRVIVIAAAGFGVTCGIAAIMPTFWTFAIMLIFVGFTMIAVNTSANGYCQSTSSAQVRGRVVALYIAVVNGGTPLGAPIVGAVANAWGARWGIGVAAMSGIAAATAGLTWLIVSRGMRMSLVHGRPQFHFAADPTAAIPVLSEYPTPDQPR